MSVTKITEPSGIAANILFAALMAKFGGGTAYIGSGSYANKAEADAIFDGMDHVATELAANFDPAGELAEDGGNLDSKAKRLKTRYETVQGRRDNKFDINLAGLGEDQKNFFESSEFSDEDHTMVIVADDGNHALVFNGLNWTCDWSGKMDELFKVVLTAEFAGPTEDKMWVYNDIAEVAAS